MRELAESLGVKVADEDTDATLSAKIKEKQAGLQRALVAKRHDEVVGTGPVDTLKARNLVERCNKCGCDVVHYKAYECRECKGYYCGPGHPDGRDCLAKHVVDGDCSGRAAAIAEEAADAKTTADAQRAAAAAVPA